MKTLDEVIMALRCTDPEVDPETKCKDCPYKESHINELWYVGPSCLDEMFADVLHYLKEYKKDREDPDGDHQQLEKAMALLQDFYRNDPLSWDELKQMEGKPVWVEGEHGFIWNHRSWVLIDPYDENDDLIICHGTDTGHYEFAIGKEDYGTDWQAYRKER